MKLQIIFILLFLLLSSIFTYAQNYTDDEFLKLEPHPNNEELFVAKFYDRDTRQLKEYWEMSSTVPNIDVPSFNELYSKRKIFADGQCYFLYENKKKMLVAEYEKGYKKGDFLGFYETGERRFKGTYNKIPIGKFVHFYKDGSFRKEENFVNGMNNGKSIFYDKTGRVIAEYNFVNGAKDGYSYLFYPNGKEKRKLKYKMDKLVSEKCFDKLGNKTDCSPLIVAPTFTGGTDVLKAEIEKIDFSFLKQMIDTIDCRIAITIDTLGNAQLKNIYILKNKLVNKNIEIWVKNLPQFQPMLFDNSATESVVNLVFPLYHNKVFWLGDFSQSQRTIKDYTTQIENEVFFWEFPVPASDEIFFIVDNMPKYPGGENALKKFISKNMRYPAMAQQNLIQGKVYVTFIVNSDGSVSDAKIAKRVHPWLDQEALRVIGLLPHWTPGTVRGNPVRVSYTVPINFALKK